MLTAVETEDWYVGHDICWITHVCITHALTLDRSKFAKQMVIYVSFFYFDWYFKVLQLWKDMILKQHYLFVWDAEDAFHEMEDQEVPWMKSKTMALISLAMWPCRPYQGWTVLHATAHERETKKKHPVEGVEFRTTYQGKNNLSNSSEYCCTLVCHIIMIYHVWVRFLIRLRLSVVSVVRPWSGG